MHSLSEGDIAVRITKPGRRKRHPDYREVKSLPGIDFASKFESLPTGHRELTRYHNTQELGSFFRTLSQ